MNEREVRRIERHRVESGLSPDKRLSTFDFAAVSCVSKAQVMALAQGHEWLQRGANVLLFGPPGVGSFMRVPRPMLLLGIQDGTAGRQTCCLQRLESSAKGKGVTW